MSEAEESNIWLAKRGYWGGRRWEYQEAVYFVQDGLLLWPLVLADLHPEGYETISKEKVIEMCEYGSLTKIVIPAEEYQEALAAAKREIEVKEEFRKLKIRAGKFAKRLYKEHRPAKE